MNKEVRHLTMTFSNNDYVKINYRTESISILIFDVAYMETLKAIRDVINAFSTLEDDIVPATKKQFDAALLQITDFEGSDICYKRFGLEELHDLINDIQSKPLEYMLTHLPVLLSRFMDSTPDPSEKPKFNWTHLFYSILRLLVVFILGMYAEVPFIIVGSVMAYLIALRTVYTTKLWEIMIEVWTFGFLIYLLWQNSHLLF